MSFFSKIASAFSPKVQTVQDTALQKRLTDRGITEATPEAVQSQVRQQSLPPIEALAKTQQSAKQIAKEVALALGTTATSAIDFTAQVLSAASKKKQLYSSPSISPLLTAFRGADIVSKQATGKGLTQQTDAINRRAEKLRRDFGYKPSEAYKFATTKQKFTDPKLLGETVRVLVPDIVASFIPYIGSAKILKSLKPAQVLIGASTANDVAREAEQYGMSEDKRLALGAITGTVVALLDKIVPDGVLAGSAKSDFVRSFGRNVVKDALISASKRGAEELITESAQEAVQLIANQTYRDVTDQEIGERLSMSALGGLLGGSGLDISTRLYRAAYSGRLDAGLSIKEIGDVEALEIAKRDPSTWSDLERAQIEQYQQKIFGGEMAQAAQESAQPFVEGSMEDNYQKFKEVLKSPQFRRPEAKEAIESGDGDRFRETMVERGIMSAEEADLLLYSQEQTTNDVFDAFKERLTKEDPGLLVGRKVAKELGMAEQVVEQLNAREADADVVSQVEAAKQELLATIDPAVLPAVHSDIDAITSREDAKAVASRIRAESRKLRLEEKSIKDQTKAVLSIANKISRGSTVLETRNAISELTRKPKGKLIQTREYTLLKRRIIDLARGYREGKRYEKEYQEAIRDLRLEEQKGKMARKNELDRLKQRIKDRERFVKQGVREGGISERRNARQIRNAIRSLITESSLDVDQKRKLLSMSKFQNISSRTDVDALAADVVARIDELTSQRKLDNLSESLQKTIESLRVKAVPGKMPKGKMEAAVQKIINTAFDEEGKNGFYAYTRRKVDGVWEYDTTLARTKIAENLERLNTEPLSAWQKFELEMENKVLRFAGALDNAKIRRSKSAAEFEELVNELKQLTDGSMTERARQAFNEETDFEQMETGVLDETLAGKELEPNTEMSERAKKGRFSGVKESIDAFLNMQYNLYSLGEKMKSSKVAKTFIETAFYNNVVKPISGAREMINTFNYRNKRDIMFALQKIYKLPGAQMTFKGNSNGLKSRKALKFMRDFFEQKSLGTFTLLPDQNGKVKQQEIRLSKGEAIYLYMVNQRDQGKPYIERGMLFGSDIMNAIEETLTPADLELVDYLSNEYYPQNREAFAPFYEKMTGVPMPDVENYVPIFLNRDTVQTVTDAKGKAKASTKANAARMTEDLSGIDETSDVRLPELKVMNVLDVAMAYSNDIATDMYMTEPLQKFRRLMRTGGPVRAAVIQEKGVDLVRELDKQIDSIAGGRAEFIAGLNAIDKATGRFAQAVLSLEPTQFAKQITAFPAWLYETTSYGNTGTVVKNLSIWVGLNKHKKVDVLNEINDQFSFLKTRGLQNIDVNVAAMVNAEDTFAKFVEGKSIDETLNSFIRAGDKAGVMTLGVPFYLARKEFHINNGMSVENAKKEAALEMILTARRTQQSTEVEDLGSIQKQNALVRAILLFTGQPLQWFRYQSMAVRNIANYRKMKAAGDVKGAKRVASIAAGQLVLTSFLYMFFQFVADGLRFDKERQIRAALLGPLNSLFIIGQILEYITNVALGEKNFDKPFEQGLTGFSGLSEAWDAISKLLKLFTNRITGEGEATDEEIHAALLDTAIFMGEVMTGKPIDNARSIVDGLVAFVRGETQSVASIFYSDYALGIDPRVKKYNDEVEMITNELAAAADNKIITKEMARAEYVKQVKKLRETYVGRYVKAFVEDELTPELATDELVSLIAKSVITKEISREIYIDFVKKYNSSTNDQRKKQLEEINKRGFFEDIKVIAEATATDPMQVFRALTTKEKLYKVEPGGIVRLVRMPQAESEAFKKKYGKNSGEWKLDHIVPLQLGGSNSDKNLRVVSTSLWKTYTPFEDAITSLVQSGKLKKKKAVELIRRVKDNEITIEQAYQEIGY